MTIQIIKYSLFIDNLSKPSLWVSRLSLQLILNIHAESYQQSEYKWSPPYAWLESSHEGEPGGAYKLLSLVNYYL